MADTERMGLTKILIPFFLVNIISGFNVDIKAPTVYDSAEKDSFFGYSLAFHYQSFSLIVGAPLSQKGPVKSGGTVFSCVYDKTPPSCDVLAGIDSITSPGEIRDEQWMGATVYSDNAKIMACAPRYMTLGPNNEKWLQGKCDDLDLFDPANDFAWKPCVNPTKRFDKQFGYCQAGFSAQLFGDGTNYAMLTGTPNVQLNIGRLAVARSDGRSTGFTPNNFLNNSEYMGYAVTSGYFGSEKKIYGVGGTPRANLLKGKVMLYDINTKNFPFFYIIHDPSKPYQTGTYFGSSMTAADINNDNFADLVIGAPYFSGTTPNEGAVYVYTNENGKSLKLAQTLYGDKETGALFGLGIGSVGDLNRDSYPDIAIGAPWGGKNQKGVVYLYYGSGNAKPLRLMQKVTAEEINPGLDGFGYSFAAYYPYKIAGLGVDILNDVDSNKYPDLAIGSYRSGHAVVLRSRPVVTIVAVLDLKGTKKIDLYSTANMCTDPNTNVKYKCIPTVNFCFSLTGINIGGSGGDVTYTLEADAEQKAGKRGFMYQNGKKVTTLKEVVSVTTPRHCIDKTIYILNNTKDIFREFVVKLSWGYQTPATCPKNICPIANKLLPLLTTKRIPFVKGCSSDGNDVCNSDLVIKVSKRLEGGSNTINVGITQVVYIDVEIENKQENAFLNKLEVVYPEELIPNNVVIENFLGTPIWYTDTTQESDVRTLAVTLTSPISPSQVEKISIEFGVLNVGKGTKEIKLSAKVVTESEEMKPADNEASVTIAVSLVANLTVSGNVLPDQVKWEKFLTNNKKIGPEITHTFFFKNEGPSSADTSDVVVNFPETFNGHYILNILSVTLAGEAGDGEAGRCMSGKMNVLGLNVSSVEPPTVNSTKLRKRRAADDIGSLSCGGGVGCREIKCTLNQLKRDTGVDMVITSTLVEATFEQFVKDSKEVKVTAKFTSMAVDKPANAPPDTKTVVLTVNSPHLTKEKEGDPIAWWIILLCILAAVLIIALLVFIMWKKGFFKRKRAGEEEDELRKGDPEDE